jgi:predicted metal-dependent hydrolase
MVRPGTDEVRRGEVLEAWYRDQLREQAKPVMAEWEKRLGVHVQRTFVQRMKTRWGSCNVARRSVRLNTDLAKKPLECLEYIIVHELVHLLEPTHNARFVTLMDQFLPGWSHRRDRLNRLPVRHANWEH